MPRVGILPAPRTRIYPLLSGAIVLGLVGSLAGAVGPVEAAAVPTPITVKWTADSSSASRFQPARNAQSPHFDEFKNISITVSQTQNVIDQALRVTITGFEGTVSSPEFGSNAMNYLQAMQCWGEDPTAANFRETCQWGGRSGPNAGLGTSVYGDNASRVSPQDASAFNPTSFDSPFRTYDGLTVSAKNTLVDPDGSGPQGPEIKIPLLDILDPTTTNEVTSARVNADGTGYFDFEAQSSDQAPQLGCGLDEHTRCWLVVVPRGTIFGGNGAECSSLIDPDNNYLPYSKWRANSFQGGSPINPKCDYWDNRVVIPLDFVQTGNTCEVGSNEVRVIGSQLMVAAMSSWQPQLCRDLSTTYSFATNPDAVARAQMLDGLAPLSFSGLPVSPGELETDADRQKLASTTFAYAPTAISGVVIAFNADFGDGKQERMVLSPRIMAKFLTQSYRFTVPSNSSDPAKNVAHLPQRNQAIIFLYQDPEFQALNPTNYRKFLRNPALVLPGPSGADALRQVWRWIQADDEAVAFLNGQADSNGFAMNPYYLPKGHPNAKVPTFTEEGEFALDANGGRVMREVGLTNIDGSPQTLATAPLDILPKADESLVPLKLTGQRSRFDTLQFSPYTDSLLSGARQAFRASPNARIVWDPSRINSAGEIGDWVAGPPQQPGEKFIITITDSPSAIRYGLSTATLVLPDSAETANPTVAAFEAALGALVPTSLDSVKQVDPAQVGPGGYPLTIVTYALVNLTESTAASRATVTAMLKQVTTSGQVSGSAIGQLPSGYLPLTSNLVSQSVSAIASIESYRPSTPTSPPQTPPVSSTSNDTFDPGTLGLDESGVDPTVTTGADSASDARTPVSAASPFLSSALVIALIIAAGGFLLGPLVLRGGRAP